MSNLAYASKLVETVVAKQLQHYLFSNDLFPVLQSAYRPNHSTETALLKVTNDILLNMNDQRVTLPFLLDLSATFETVNHDTLLHRLQFTFGINGKSSPGFRLTCLESLSKKPSMRHYRVAMCLSRFLFGPLIIYSVFEKNSSRSANTIFLRFTVTLMTRRYTTHSAKTTGSINLMLESYWTVVLLIFVLGCCMTILN